MDALRPESELQQDDEDVHVVIGDALPQRDDDGEPPTPPPPQPSSSPEQVPQPPHAAVNWPAIFATALLSGLAMGTLGCERSLADDVALVLGLGDEVLVVPAMLTMTWAVVLGIQPQADLSSAILTLLVATSWWSASAMHVIFTYGCIFARAAQTTDVGETLVSAARTAVEGPFRAALEWAAGLRRSLAIATGSEESSMVMMVHGAAMAAAASAVAAALCGVLQNANPVFAALVAKLIASVEVIWDVMAWIPGVGRAVVWAGLASVLAFPVRAACESMLAIDEDDDAVGSDNADPHSLRHRLGAATLAAAVVVIAVFVASDVAVCVPLFALGVAPPAWTLGLPDDAAMSGRALDAAIGTFSGITKHAAVWLVVALVMTASLTLAVFSQRLGLDREHPTLRRLGLALASGCGTMGCFALWRLIEYIRFNGCTLPKIFGFVGVVAVLAGCGAVAYKIRAHKTNLWLWRRLMRIGLAAIAILLIAPIDSTAISVSVVLVERGELAAAEQIHAQRWHVAGLPNLLPLLDHADARIAAGTAAVLNAAQPKLAAIQDTPIFPLSSSPLLGARFAAYTLNTSHVHAAIARALEGTTAPAALDQLRAITREWGWPGTISRWLEAQQA